MSENISSTQQIQENGEKSLLTANHTELESLYLIVPDYQDNRQHPNRLAAFRRINVCEADAAATTGLRAIHKRYLLSVPQRSAPQALI